MTVDGRRFLSVPVFRFRRAAAMSLAFIMLVSGCSPDDGAVEASPADDAANGSESEGPVVDGRVQWSMRERHVRGSDVYDDATSSYRDEYVYPDRWMVDFDACSRFPQRSDRTYEWSVSMLQGPFETSRSSTTCRLEDDSGLPVLTDYRVSVKVFDSGVYEGGAATDFTPKDLLIVAFGDSIASGEGRAAFYGDQCHLSDNSGFSRAARRIEATDPHTSVTFLNLACSGAGLVRGVLFPQQDYPGSRNRVQASQMHELYRSLCGSNIQVCRERPRSVDKVFVNVGANDLGWSNYLRQCGRDESLNELEIEDVIPLLSVLDLRDVSWEDLKDKPLQTVGDHVFEQMDAFAFPLGLDEIILSYYDDFMEGLDYVLDLLGLPTLGWVDNSECRSDKASRALTAGTRGLRPFFALLDRFLDGDGREVVEDALAGHGTFTAVTQEDRLFVICAYGDDAQKRRAGANCGSAPGMEHVPDIAGVSRALFSALRTEEIYLTSYAVDTLSNREGELGGCGPLGGVSSEDASWFLHHGTFLNISLGFSADFLRWNFVRGITERFQTDGGVNHGYCAGADSWFIDVYEGRTEGTLHPTPDGYDAIADELLGVLEAGPVLASEDYVVDIEFLDAQVSGPGDLPTAGQDSIRLEAYERLRRGGATLDTVVEFDRNAPVPLHNGEATVRIDGPLAEVSIDPTSVA